jgi:hypothetical protein
MSGVGVGQRGVVDQAEDGRRWEGRDREYGTRNREHGTGDRTGGTGGIGGKGGTRGTGETGDAWSKRKATRMMRFAESEIRSDVRTFGLTHIRFEREIHGVPLRGPRQTSIRWAIELDGLSTVNDRPPVSPFYRREKRFPAQLREERFVVVPHWSDGEEEGPPPTIGPFY